MTPNARIGARPYASAASRRSSSNKVLGHVRVAGVETMGHCSGAALREARSGRTEGRTSPLQRSGLWGVRSMAGLGLTAWPYPTSRRKAQYTPMPICTANAENRSVTASADSELR